jgi:hemerythrin-like domain-containing protein
MHYGDQELEATQALSQDHRTIERLLDSLEEAASRLLRGERVRPGFFLDAAQFIAGFADACHHRKEEGALFPAMEAAGLPRSGGPISVMLHEHERGRQYTAAMREAAQKLASGDHSAADEVVENAHGYVALLRQHIMKEDNILFQMAQRVLGPDKQHELSEEFERIESAQAQDGSHGKYLALVEALEREMER